MSALTWEDVAVTGAAAPADVPTRDVRMPSARHLRLVPSVGGDVAVDGSGLALTRRGRLAIGGGRILGDRRRGGAPVGHRRA